MRIAVGGYSHETNSFSNNPVTQEVLDQRTWVGEAWFKRYTGVETYHGGFIDEAKELGIELIATRASSLQPSGPTVRGAFEAARDHMVELMSKAYAEQPYDGIALALHGAGCAEGYPDLEGEILRALREKMGKDIPIGVVLDLHGNISPEMVEYADIIIGVKCYPHIDEYSQGRTVMRLLHDMIQSGKRPYKKLIKLPWLVAPATGVTTSGPAHDVQQQLIRCEQADPQLLQASFFHGFPYSDVDIVSASVITVAETQEAADRNALAIANYAWDHRADFKVPLLSAEEAVDEALKYPEGPVLIHESSDNPGGGAPGDSTHLLRELLRRDIPSAFGYIYDPEVAQQAAKAGVGATISCRLGAKTDKLHGEPIELEAAYVKSINDGDFILKSPMSRGALKRMGLTAHLVVGNVHIVVGSDRSQTFDDGPFMAAGVDWTATPILALKSSQHFKGWWADKVKAIVCCDSPGIHCSNLTVLPFTRTNTSYYPLQDAQWNA